MAEPDSTISIPSLLFVIVAGGFLIRWIFFSPATRGGASGGRGRPINLTAVEQIHQMFPQLDRRDIAWDLHRNGWNVAATSERMLSQGRLDRAPVSYQPAGLTPSTPAPATRTSSSKAKSTEKDLIQRYNLSAKVAAQATDKGKGKEVAEDAPPTGKGKSAWASSRGDRMTLIQKRREEMILNARRKMEEKDQETGR